MLVALGLATGALVLGPAVASAHPLGNFTINLYSGIVVEPGRLQVDYVMDMAEIPTFQQMHLIDANGDGRADPEELGRYAAHKSPELARGVEVTSADRSIALRVSSSTAKLRPGQGGLPILRLQAVLTARLARTGAIRLVDSNDPDRIGWREITAVGADGSVLRSSSVPGKSVSDALLHYPKGLLSSPLHVTSAHVVFGPGRSGAAPALPTGPMTGARPAVAGGAFARLATWSGLSLPALVVAFALALAFGAVHALLPGHGKTIMAAYLVGAGGRTRQAVQVGVAVALMHTFSVLALGVIVLALTAYAPEQAYPWLTLASGVFVLGLGGGLVWVRGRHRHGHAHDHAHDHPHPETDRPLSRRSLVGLALAGGILPSPTALVVLLSTVHQHRVAFGLSLIVAFSVGLAAALVTVGLLALRARAALAPRLSGRLAHAVPLVSAAAIVVVGAVLVTQALARL
jgi:nickel/cobalt exporter